MNQRREGRAVDRDAGNYTEKSGRLTFNGEQAPPYIFPLLIMSKRLHSLFMLRLFNDCFVVGALFVAIYAYQRRLWTIGSIAFTGGVGIKMSLLLALPGVLVIMEQGLPFPKFLKSVFLMIQLQVR